MFYVSMAVGYKALVFYLYGPNVYVCVIAWERFPLAGGFPSKGPVIKTFDAIFTLSLKNSYFHNPTR